jgi:membrane fusion protein (multidrug efflux system)
MKLARKKIILLIAVILAISMIFYFRHHKPANDYPKPAVTTEVLKTETSRDALQAVGTLKASDSVNIVSQVSGVVKTIAFHSGQTVKQGQILATLEDDDLQATLKEAEAKADNAADYLSRMKKLAPSESIAKVELDKAAADSKAASAEVEFDTAKLNQFTITAPFDGMLGIRQISQGQYLKPGDSVVNCESLSPMHVDFNVPAIFMWETPFNLV